MKVVFFRFEEWRKWTRWWRGWWGQCPQKLWARTAPGKWQVALDNFAQFTGGCFISAPHLFSATVIPQESVCSIYHQRCSFVVTCFWNTEQLRLKFKLVQFCTQEIFSQSVKLTSSKFSLDALARCTCIVCLMSASHAVCHFPYWFWGRTW